ncbi:MAG: hypothetical protein ABFQ64_07720 [Campylobacterota bacterium]
MKTFFIVITALLTANLNANELAWVDEQVEAIKPPRTGMKSRELSILKDPFIFLKKNRTDESKKKSTKRSSAPRVAKSATSSTSGSKKIVKKKKGLTLSAVINTSAMINGKWYKIGDKISGYKVTKMDSTSVLLTKKSKKLLLSTNSKNKNLNFNNK